MIWLDPNDNPPDFGRRYLTTDGYYVVIMTYYGKDDWSSADCPAAYVKGYMELPNP